MKCLRVIAVAHQGAHTVVVGHRLQRIVDGVRQDRMCADLDECRVLLCGGDDGLAQQRGLAQIGHPVLGIQHRIGDALGDGGIEGDRDRVRDQIG